MTLKELHDKLAALLTQGTDPNLEVVKTSDMTDFLKTFGNPTISVVTTKEGTSFVVIEEDLGTSEARAIVVREEQEEGEEDKVLWSTDLSS